MKYWELWFLTVGAGCYIGAIISPASWMAVFWGSLATWLGWIIHKKGERK